MTEAVNEALSALFIDVQIPRVEKYKYLGVRMSWHLNPSVGAVRAAVDECRDKFKGYAFRFGNLRENIKFILLMTYVEQEYRYRVFPLI